MKREEDMKKFIYALLMIIIFSSGIIYGEELEENPYLTEKAKVLEIIEIEEVGEDNFNGQIQHGIFDPYIFH